MPKLNLKFYTDPGHGWLAVKRKLIEELNISNQISLYSYAKGQTAYLEEDRDAEIFMNAAKNAGYEVSFVSKHTEKTSPIRSYDSFLEWF